MRVNTMSSIPVTDAAHPPAGDEARLPAPLVLLAMGAGLAVAALYYSQPMLGVLGADIGASIRAIGFVPTLTQLGYALGILFLVPLGMKPWFADLGISNAVDCCARFQRGEFHCCQHRHPVSN